MGNVSVFNAVVSSLIINGQWAIPSLMARYTPDISELILSTEIRGGGDEIVWAPAANGMFSLADTYNFLRSTKAPWKWSSLVWFTARIPRHAFVAWLTLRGGLKTLKKLKDWNVVQSDVCVHCWHEQET